MANGNISDAFADILIAAWLTRDVTALPATYWVGLTLDLPTDSNGTGLLAPTAVDYHRIGIPANAASWTSMGAGSRSMESAVEVLWAAAVADWGEINGYTLYASEVGGMFLGFGITDPLTILAGMIARLPAGLIVVSLP